MYYTQEQIDRANQADLVSFLQGRGEQLTRAGQEYRWKRHDSLTVRGNKWYRHSQSKGGAPIDFVMEFYGKSFTEAVELLTGEKGAAPPPDRPSPAPLSDFRLPPRNTDNRTARNYLTAARRIDEDVSGFFFSTGDIYEEAAHHNAVFVGRDESGIPRYAHQRGTAGSFRLDVKGSDKAFNFCYRGEGERLFVFEAPIDLLSFLCLFKKDWQKQSYLALGGVGEKALLRFLSDRLNIKTVYLCLDSDQAGNDACSRLVELMPEGLTVRGTKWYRHSQSKGGGPVDFLMEFFGKSFTEAVELLTGEKGAAPPPDSPAPLSDFRLPPRSPTAEQVKRYLTEARRIDEDVTGFFISSGDIYEEAAHHNAVFVGRDESGIPRYAHQRGTAGSFRLDVKGSDKAFNFCYRGEGERLFVFEAPIDLLSFLCLFKKDWQKQSYLSLGGVGEKALLRFLSDRPNIKTVFLCLDSDEAGNDACSRLVKLMPEGLTVHRLVPLCKDWNEVLQHRAEITDGKYLREAIYGLKEPPQEETVEIIRMSEVDTQTVEWLLLY